MTAHEILVATRNRVAKGWCIGGTFWDDRERCLVGHMASYATNVDPEEFMYCPDAELAEMDVDSEVIEARALSAALVEYQPHMLYQWNDGHSKQEVLTLLDEAILESAPEPDLDLEVPEPVLA